MPRLLGYHCRLWILGRPIKSGDDNLDGGREVAAFGQGVS